MKSTKALAILVSVLLSLSLVSPAFAEEYTLGLDDEETSEELSRSSEDISSENPQSLDSRSSAESGEFETEVFDSDALPDAGISSQELMLDADEYTVEYTQVDTSTEVKVGLPNSASLKALTTVDSITIEATMSYGGETTRAISYTKALAEIDDFDPVFTMDFTTYGKFSVTAKFYKDGALVKTGATSTFGVVADEYNIAPVSATLPVTFFSLSLWGSDSIRYASDGTVVPTILLMERPNAYNWDNLPEGVYGLPYITEAELSYQPGNFTVASNLFREHSAAMNAYVADLYELSPSAKFNVYIVDHYVGLAQSIIYANKIPTSQYTLTILSDGSFSYSNFTKVYGDSNPTATHQALMDEWNIAKTEAYTTGLVKEGYKLNDPNRSVYAAVDADPNASWWIARASNLVTNGDGGAFGVAARSNPKVKQFNISQKLTSLQGEGAAAVQEFKALYNFSDSYFSEAEENGKEVMLFLGTTVWLEKGDFSDYARFVMAHCGDDYQYYYKGHPGTPTEFYPEKQEELELLGITDVDSSIAAELILFFYPELSLSGYTSSTYASMTDPDMAKGLFRLTKAQALADTTSNYSMMDFYISPVTSSTDAKIRELCKPFDNNYLVEFSDSALATSDYTLAIWNSTTSTINYYLLDGESYLLVRSIQAGGRYIDGGVYTIESRIAPGKVIDIAGASTADRSNAQIYDNNESTAQTFQINHVGDGYYTIQNIKSRKMLDVAGASASSGTNVQQYSDNKTDAQKWKLQATGDSDGSYYLVSKCNGLYLDQQWGGTLNETNLWVYTGNFTDAQKFVLNKITPIKSDSTAFTIGSKLSPSIALDISKASKEPMGNAQIYQRNATEAQVFDFVYDASTGYYTIVNRGSGMALDVAGASTASGANVWQYTRNGTDAQRWRIRMVDENTYTIYSATGGGCCLDISGARTENYTNVQVYRANNTDAQKWTLEAL